MNCKDLTFIATTNSRNFAFTLPFIYFAAKHNPNCKIDLYLYDDCNIKDIKDGLAFLNTCVDCKINIKDKIQSNTTPSLYRFLVEPISQTKYSYCGDIDIMICEDILPFHIKKLKNEKYCYDNEIRQYSDPLRMSGLHFCTQKWYEQTKIARNKLLLQNISTNAGKNNCDEILLKKMAEDSHVLLQPIQLSVEDFNKNRPTHGQHISLSRRPFNPTCQMEDRLDPIYKKSFLETIKSDQFIELMQLSPKETKQIFNTYLQYVKLNDRF